MRLLATIFVLMFISLGAFAQTQTIKGRVTIEGVGDAAVGATVMILNTQLGANVDENGNYEIKNVPVGRVLLICSYFGTNTYSDAQNLTIAKALIYDFEVAGATLESEDILPSPIPSSATNADNLAATSFDIDQIQRSTGNVNDPSRYAMTLPGVQPVRDDNSDIVIRGNAPTGLLWRIEGIDMPNPNHFARKGNTGGGITMLSAQVLGKSDFSTGAFPAEYGNALSGVFDLNFRKGDMENREYRFKLGLLGIDFATEGPIKNERSSYLINYRYSTLGILNDLGFRLLDPRIDNTFQDLSFNLYFRSKDYTSEVKVFGVGGISEELWDPISDSLLWSNSYRSEREYLTYMGTLGASYRKLIDEKSFFKATAAVIYNRVTDFDDTLDISSFPQTLPGPSNPNIDDLSRGRFESEDYQNFRIATHLRYVNQLSKTFRLKAGLIGTYIQFGVDHQIRDLNTSNVDDFRTVVSGEGNSILLQPYLQGSYATADKRLQVNGGLHGMYLSLNNTYSIEPRLNVKYNLNPTNSIIAAYGLHGRILPLGNYFTQVVTENNGIIEPNKDLEIMKSHHAVLGFEHVFKSGDQPFARLSIQGYYQYLFDIPVSSNDTSAFWLLNQRDGYAAEALESVGTGTNRGVDVSYQQFFNGGFYSQLSASLYSSQFTTKIPDRTFSTKFDGRYLTSLMAGKEFTIGKDRSKVSGTGPGLLTIATRVIYAGGLRYSPGDPELSQGKLQPVIPVDSTFARQLNDYFRVDLRLAYRKSFKKTAIQFSLDVQNITANRNDREELWDPTLGRFFIQRQSGLIPVFSFQFDF